MTSPSTTRRPNILLIHADQLRYDALGCTGNPAARTPNLDRLAAAGTTCTRHIAANPVCMPSRASLFTGLYPPAHNVWNNGVALPRQEYARYTRHNAVRKFQPEPTTLADCFADAGYDTASFGKLHLTPNLAPAECGYPETWANWADEAMDGWHGPYYGFRDVDLTEGHGEQPCRQGHYARWLKTNHPGVAKAVRDGGARRPVEGLNDLYASPVPHELHNTTWLAERFASYIEHERPTDRPFFAFIGFPDPHHPFTPSFDVLEEFLDADPPAPIDPTGEAWNAYSDFREVSRNSIAHLPPDAWRAIRRYTLAQTCQIDRAVGRILAALEASGVADETAVVFTSDHGDYLGDHGLLRKSHCACDALLHVPFILHAPFAAGLPTEIAAATSNCDVLPTLADLAGIPAPAGLDGRSLLDSAHAPASEHAAFAFSANGEPEVQNYTVYDDRYRLTWYPNTGFVELYDHRDDPGECLNVANQQPQRVADMQDRIRERLALSYHPILKREGAW